MKESMMKSQVREGESFNKRGGMDRDGRGGRRLRGEEMWADVKVPRSGISEEFSYGNVQRGHCHTDFRIIQHSKIRPTYSDFQSQIIYPTPMSVSLSSE